MATGRTVSKFVRPYIAGYDFGGLANTIAELKWEFDESDLTAAMGDSVTGRLPGMVNISCGAINAVFDNTTAKSHAIGVAGNSLARAVMVAIGMRAEPVMGDWAWCAMLRQAGYQAVESGGGAFCNLTFNSTDPVSATKYTKPWGNLLHAKGAETGANSANTNVDNGAATTAGGFLMYQVFAGDGTATISIDDSANGTDWLALSGATTGVTDFSNPVAGIVQLATTATVRQYLRWQLALGTANTVTFALAFVRG
jgi:hypothetical protein